MDLSSIIVSYNTFELTRTAILSILESSRILAQEVIVVDNNSPDGSGPRLRDHFDTIGETRVRVIDLDTNRGFAAANNLGATHASGDVLFFLNPDTISRDGLADAVYQFLSSRADAGAVGPRVLNEDGTDQASISTFPSVASLLRFYFPVTALFQRLKKDRFMAPKSITEVDVVKGCALAVRREVFDSVGGWDASYFLYSEENEFCLSLQQANFKNFFLPDARVVHLGGASTVREDYAEQQIIQQRSALQFLKRHKSPGFIALNRVLGLLGFGFRGVVFGILALGPGNTDFRLRGQAARRIFRWFMTDYSV
jgi:N-acetylglucosaminyl-diphospho-decaprenol L-rhamnosyltransferase